MVIKHNCQIAQVVVDVLGALVLYICRDDQGVFGAEMDVPRSLAKRVIY